MIDSTGNFISMDFGYRNSYDSQRFLCNPSRFRDAVDYISAKTSQIESGVRKLLSGLSAKLNNGEQK